MPRTKRPVRKQEKPEGDDILKSLNRIALDQKNKIDSRLQMERRNLELAFKIVLGSMSNVYLQKTIGDCKRERNLQEITNTTATTNSTRADSHDDGYLTENSSHGSGDRGTKKYQGRGSTTRRSAARSRSAEASARKMAPPTANKTIQRRRSKSVYRTPAYNKHATNNYPPITPKVTPQTSLTVLRQPRQGEMVVSMSGSPVMVPTCYNMQAEERANCNIMLQDGTMLSLQPKQLRQSQAYIPFSLMDPQVLTQLKTLKDNLDKVVKLGEKAYK